MSSNDENKFKDAIKVLAAKEPEKLAFYTGEKTAGIMPSLKKYAAKNLRRYTLAMAASAACMILFLGMAILNYSPGLSAGDQAVSESAPAVEYDSGHSDSATRIQTIAVKNTQFFVLEIILAAVFAALFVFFIFKRKKLSSSPSSPARESQRE